MGAGAGLSCNSEAGLLLILHLKEATRVSLMWELPQGTVVAVEHTLHLIY